MKKLMILNGFVCVLCVCGMSSVYALDPKDDNPQISFGDSANIGISKDKNTTSFSLMIEDFLEHFNVNLNIGLISKDEIKAEKKEQFIDKNGYNLSLYVGSDIVYFKCRDIPNDILVKVRKAIYSDAKKEINNCKICKKDGESCGEDERCCVDNLVKGSVDSICEDSNYLNELEFNTTVDIYGNRVLDKIIDKDFSKSGCYESAIFVKDGDFRLKVAYLVNNVLYKKDPNEVKSICKNLGVGDNLCEVMVSLSKYIDIKNSYGFSPFASMSLGGGGYVKGEVNEKSIYSNSNNGMIDPDVIDMAEEIDVNVGEQGIGVYGYFYHEKFGFASLRGFAFRKKILDVESLSDVEVCKSYTVKNGNGFDGAKECKDISVYFGDVDSIEVETGLGFSFSYSKIFNVSGNGYDDFLEGNGKLNWGLEVRDTYDSINKNVLRLSVFSVPGFSDNPLNGRLGFSLEHRSAIGGLHEEDAWTPYIYVGGAVF